MLKAPVKQRNWLLDLFRIPAAFCIAINHFMQRWNASIGSAYDSGASYFTQTYIWEDGWTAGGYYCLGFFTFISGYFFIDWFKKQQKANLIGRGKDCLLLWRYWGKTYSSYWPYVLTSTLPSLLGTLIIFRVPLKDWFFHFANMLPEMLGFGEFGLTVPQEWMTVVKHLFVDPEWTPSITQPWMLGSQVWYLSTLICYAVALMLIFFISEKIALFGAGPYFLMMFFKTNWDLSPMSDPVVWNINRMFGPMFIGIYAWYLIDYLHHHSITKNVQRAINIGAVLSFAGYIYWRTMWTTATFVEADTMWCLVCFFTLLNMDFFTKGINKFLGKISFVSKHFASVGMGVFSFHYLIMNTIRYMEVKNMIPWFTEAYGGVKFTIYVSVLLLSGIFFVPIDIYVVRPFAKWLAKLFGCNKPIVIDENTPAKSGINL